MSSSFLQTLTREPMLGGTYSSVTACVTCLETSSKPSVRFSVVSELNMPQRENQCSQMDSDLTLISDSGI